jgi:hypothetical protein
MAQARDMRQELVHHLALFEDHKISARQLEEQVLRLLAQLPIEDKELAEAVDRLDVALMKYFDGFIGWAELYEEVVQALRGLSTATIDLRQPSIMSSSDTRTETVSCKVSTGAVRSHFAWAKINLATT